MIVPLPADAPELLAFAFFLLAVSVWQSLEQYQEAVLLIYAKQVFSRLASPRIHNLGIVCGTDWGKIGLEAVHHPEVDPLHPTFLHLFRMSKSAFSALWKLLDPLPPFQVHVRPGRPGRGRPSLPLIIIMMIALYRLGHTADVRTIAIIFGVSSGSVCGATSKFIVAVRQHLFHNLVYWPSASAAVKSLSDSVRTHEMVVAFVV